MQRVIKTATRTVTLGQYLRAWKAVLASPAGSEFRYSLCSPWPASREVILKEFSEGVHDRINRHIPGYGVGRKWSSDWQREAQHAANWLNHPRLIIDWLPTWLKERYAHRLRRNIEA
jgi:hypothetical protein